MFVPYHVWRDGLIMTYPERLRWSLGWTALEVDAIWPVRVG